MKGTIGKIQTYLSGRLSLLVIACTMLAVIWINFNNKFWLKQHGVVKHDIVSYYSYLPAAFVYKDLSFRFFDEDPDYFYDKMYRYEAPNGGLYQKVSMGLAFLYLPFFLAGHVVAHLGGFETSGYSAPYTFALLFSSAFYLLLAMLIIRAFLKRYNKDWIVALVMLAVVPGTHMLHNATFEAAMPHIYNFFLIILFIWFTDKWYNNKSLKHTVALGLTFGLISLIRPSNALIAVFFIFYDVKSLRELIRRPAFFLANFKHVLVIATCTLLVWLPQMIHWKLNTGSWFFYSYEGESFFFGAPQILNGLFSYRKGWLIYTPVMLFALLGIAALYREKREMFLPVLVFSVLNVYIIFSWWAWWYGGSFGMRPMIDTYGLMIISLAAPVTYMDKKGALLRSLTVAVLLLLAAHGIFQTIQYRYGAIHYDSMTKAAYWDSFGRISPTINFKHLLEQPDYELAKQGIQSVIEPMKPAIRRKLSCDYETILPDGLSFRSSDARFSPGSAALQTSLQSRSGLYGIMLTVNNPYGSRIDMLVRTGEAYTLSVWQYPYDAPGRIVLSAQKEADFYRASNEVVQVENGWGKIELKVKIPDYITGLMKVYLYNPGAESIIFDDFFISR